VKKIAVLGSGVVGDTLSAGFAKHGYAVMRGSREPSKLAGSYDKGTFEQAAAWGDAVVLAVKGSAAEAIVTSIAAAVAGKLVIDSTNPIADGPPPKTGVLEYFTAQNESLMERLQKLAPSAQFVKAFNSVGSPLMVNPKTTATPTMFICGNDAGAKAQTTQILTQFGWDTLDCGGVEAARPIESLCMLWCIPGFQRNDWMHAFKMVYPA
jgi:predicted dinucleotide-binding enzyme